MGCSGQAGSGVSILQCSLLPGASGCMPARPPCAAQASYSNRRRQRHVLVVDVVGDQQLQEVGLHSLAQLPPHRIHHLSTCQAQGGLSGQRSSEPRPRGLTVVRAAAGAQAPQQCGRHALQGWAGLVLPCLETGASQNWQCLAQGSDRTAADQHAIRVRVRVEGLGFSVEGLGFSVEGLGLSGLRV